MLVCILEKIVLENKKMYNIFERNPSIFVRVMLFIYLLNDLLRDHLVIYLCCIGLFLYFFLL